MEAEVGILIITAFSIGFLHTILGPDHYVPFVAMARANKWSAQRTFSVTIVCGLGHVFGSLVIGTIGLLLGTVVMELETLESWRGEAAAWLLIGFGLAYLTWGILRALRDLPHTHLHSHADGTVHSHLHKHDLDHCHVHAHRASKKEGRQIDAMTPWLLFLLFVFGPCEALIPLLMVPAAESNWLAILAVVMAFTFATLATMTVAVFAALYGLDLIRLPDLHRFSHVLAGFAIVVCGVLVKFGL